MSYGIVEIDARWIAILDSMPHGRMLFCVNSWLFRMLVGLTILSVASCGLPGAAARSMGAVSRTGQSMGRTLSKLSQ
jgi:hypothetical protein